MTVKLSQERKVRSLAKKTFGSTRVGRAIRLPVSVFGFGVSWDDGCWKGIGIDEGTLRTWGGLEKRLA